MALNALLAEMDGFAVDPRRPVFVLAATNFSVEERRGSIGHIDPALARRFDRKILVDLPTKDDRKRYIEYALTRRIGHTVTAEMIDRLAGRSAGLSLANLESVMEHAARSAAKQDKALCDELLDEAYEISRHGDVKTWGSEYLERVARHEAGHAYLCYLTGRTPSYVTIVARDDHGGYMEFSDSESMNLLTKEELLARIRTSLGGRAAELVYYGRVDGVSSGASGDLQSATNLAKAMLIYYGMDNEFGLAALSRDEAERGPLSVEIRNRINSILSDQMEKTIVVIERDKAKVERLANALLEKNKLTKEEIEAILTIDNEQLAMSN
jgi:ATP-dependent Zn protease